jgi:predicted Zn finger-like uncharacterized protein
VEGAATAPPMKFLCDICKAKYQISDEKVSGKTVRMKCRRCGHLIEISAAQMDAATEVGTGRSAAEDVPGGGLHTEGEVLESLPEAVKHAPTPRIHDEVTDEPTAVLLPERGPVPPAVASQPFALTTPRTASSPSLRAVPSRPLASPPVSGASAAHPPPAASSAPRPLGLVPRAGAAAATPATPRAPLGSPAAPRPLTSPRPLGLPTSPRPSPTSAAALRPAGSPLSAPSHAPESPAPPAMEAALRRSVAVEPTPLAHPTSAPTENWYVGVSGVPLGPIRLAVIREKAASGAVTSESLVWREGLDEWLPLRHFPELLELVEEARAGAAKPAHTLAPTSHAMSPAPAAVPPAFAAPPAAPPALSPSFQPLASPTAHPADAPSLAPKDASPAPFDTHAFTPTTIPSPAGPEPAPAAPPAAPALAGAVVTAAPLAPPAPAAANEPPAPYLAAGTVTATSPAHTAAPSEPMPAPSPERRRAAMHPAAYAFIAMAAAFGGVAAFVLLSPTTPAPTPAAAPIATQAAPPAYDPGAAAVPAPPPPEATAAATAAPVVPLAGAAGTPRPGTGGGPAPEKGTPAAPIDTAGFGSPGGVAGPSATPEGPNSGGALPSTLTAGEIQGVVSANQASIRRKCWEPALDAAGVNGKKSAKVTASVTIAPSGSVSAVSASGGSEFPGLASCIQTRIKGWKFPAAGGESRTAIPFVFASQ